MAVDGTKFILFGGADRAANPEQKARLAAEIKKGLTQSPKILSVLFAEKREDWGEKFESRRGFFAELFDTDYKVELAFPETFEAQLAEVNTVYLHGGDTTLLTHYLDKVANLPKLMAGKIVVGSSAGAEYLSTAYWTPDWREQRIGRGLVPAKVIVHYDSAFGAGDWRGPIDWQAQLSGLQEKFPDLPVYALPEGEFVAIEVAAEQVFPEKVKLQNYPRLRAWLQREFAAVLTMPIDNTGGLHAAAIAYYHIEYPLTFYFVTSETSEKCTLLRVQDAVRAACAIGTYKGTEFTLQMRGELRITSPSPEVAEAYYQKRGNRRDDLNAAGVVCLAFTPDWARFTDYAEGYGHRWLDLS